MVENLAAKFIGAIDEVKEEAGTITSADDKEVFQVRIPAAVSLLEI